MKDLTAYIDSLMTGEIMTKNEWLDWISKEEKDFKETLTEEEIDYIISKLNDAKLVK